MHAHSLISTHPQRFVELYSASQSNAGLDAQLIKTPAKIKVTGSALEDIFLPDPLGIELSNAEAFGHWLIFLAAFICTLSIGPIVAQALRNQRTQNSRDIASQIQQRKINDANNDNTNRNDSFNWLYQYKAEEVREILQLVDTAITALKDNQDNIMQSVNRKYRETETTLLDNLPDHASLIVKGGIIFGKKDDTLTQLMSFAEYVNINKIQLNLHLELTGKDLSDLDLSGLDLTDQQLESIDLSGTKLIGAKMTGMYMDKVNLDNADLTNADMQNFTLKNSSMNQVIITADQLDQIEFENTTITQQPAPQDDQTSDSHLTSSGEPSSMGSLVSLSSSSGSSSSFSSTIRSITSVSNPIKPNYPPLQSVSEEASGETSGQDPDLNPTSRTTPATVALAISSVSNTATLVNVSTASISNSSTTSNTRLSSESCPTTSCSPTVNVDSSGNSRYLNSALSSTSIPSLPVINTYTNHQAALATIEPVPQTARNHMVTALATVARFFNPGQTNLINDLELGHGKNTWSFIDKEKDARTTDGLTKLAKEVGLQARIVKPDSEAAYAKHVTETLQSGKPLIAPFLVDNRSQIVKEQISGSEVSQEKNVNFGKPVTQQQAINAMAKPLKELVTKSNSVKEFEQSVNTCQSLNKSSPAVSGTTKTVTKLAIHQFPATVDVLQNSQSEDEFKSRCLQFDDLICQDLNHSCVITGYNDTTQEVTVKHSGRSYQTSVKALYESANLLPGEFQAALITFDPITI